MEYDFGEENYVDEYQLAFCGYFLQYQLIRINFQIIGDDLFFLRLLFLSLILFKSVKQSHFNLRPYTFYPKSLQEKWCPGSCALLSAQRDLYYSFLGKCHNILEYTVLERLLHARFRTVPFQLFAIGNLAARRSKGFLQNTSGQDGASRDFHQSCCIYIYFL